MPGRYRDTHPWPLFGLRITTPRLELRMPGRRGSRRALRGGARGHPSGRTRCRSAFRGPTGSQEPGALRALPRLPLDDARRDHPGALVAAVRRGRRGPHRRHAGAQGRGLRRQPQRVQRVVADGVRRRAAGSASRCARPCCTSRSPASARSRRRRRPGSTTRPPSASRCGSATCTRASSCWRGAASRRATCATASRARRGKRNHFDGIELHGLEPCLRAARRCMNLHQSV